MRVLLDIGEDAGEDRLRSMLEANGQEVVRAGSRGEELVAFIGGAEHLHAAVVSQVSLGKKWPRLLRQIRKQAPRLPVVLLLGPRADRTWRLAILAGAFEAVPASAPEAAMQALSRALGYVVGKAVGELFITGTPSEMMEQSVAESMTHQAAVASRH